MAPSHESEPVQHHRAAAETVSFLPIGTRFQFFESVLVAIEKKGEALPSQIGEALHLDRSTLSRTMERLKERGWVEELEGDDGRSCPMRLSNAGREIIRKAYPLWQNAQRMAAKL